MSLRSVQDWEAGATLPSAERVRGLLRTLLEVGGLTPGSEMSEARDLWATVERESPRMHTPFDEAWFARLLAAPADSSPARAREPLESPPGADAVRLTPDRAQDWGDALDTTGFVGRVDQLALLQHWVLDEHCRLVAILGMGGIGKTSLAARLAESMVPAFDRVYWRSLRNAPLVTEWLAGAIDFLSDHEMVGPRSESDQIPSLLQLLRTRRCLLVLDNSETLFEAGQREGQYRSGMEGYGRMLRAVAEARHQSCLVLTSREAPPELAVVGSGARALELHGLGTAEVQTLVADKQLRGDTQAWDSLVERYAGNGLALKVVGDTVHQLYDGDIDAFLSDAIATYGTVFGGIRRLLDVQLQRLSTTERHVLRRLAVEREPVSLAELSREMAPRTDRSTVLDGIETLRRRSLVERAEGGAAFTLQSMVLEYVTDRLVDTVADEISRGEPIVVGEQPLIKAQAKDYVRQTQERLIGAPILQQLKSHLTGSEPELRLLGLLHGWRGLTPLDQGYGPGNVVNLLRLLRGDLRDMDLSRLALRQVYLQGVDAQDAKFVGTHLAEVVLAESFAYPTAVAVSADGALLAVGTLTGEARLWHAADRTLLMALSWRAVTIWSVALSADGQLLAVGSDDATIRLVETRTQQLRATLRGHIGAVRSVSFSGDGRLVASGGVDGTVKLWAAEGGQLLATLEGHTGAIWGVALSGDARLVASGGVDGTLRIWGAASGQLLATRAHTAAIWGVALSGDGRLVASAGVDGTVKLWTAPGGQLLDTLEGHTGAVWGVGLSGDGRLVASGGVDGTVRLWDVDAAGGHLRATLQGHAGAVRGLALSADGRLVASGGVDGTVRLWAAERGQLLATVQGQIDVVVDVALSADGRLVLSAGADGTVRLWDQASGQLLAVLLGHSGLVYRVALSRDGRLAASAGADGTVRLWDAPFAEGDAIEAWTRRRPGSGALPASRPSEVRPRAVLQEHVRLVFGLALSGHPRSAGRGGRLVASGGADGMVRLWEADSGALVASLQGHDRAVRGVALSEDGRLVASGGDDGTARLWDTASGQLLATLQVHPDAVRGVALSGDGRLLASGGADGTIRVWETATRALRTSLAGHDGAVRGLAFSADARLLATGDNAGTVRLWDLDSGQLRATMQGHTADALGVAFSGDARLLASGSGDGTIRIWDVSGGTCLNTLQNDRPFQRADISGLSGVTEAQRAALFALGAIEQRVSPPR